MFRPETQLRPNSPHVGTLAAAPIPLPLRGAVPLQVAAVDAAGRRVGRDSIAWSNLGRVGRAAGAGRRPRRLERGGTGPGRPGRGQDGSRPGAGLPAARTATACRSGSTPATCTTSIAPGGSATAFIFLPGGGGPRLDEPVAQWLPIHRAREQPRPIAPGQLQVRSEKRHRGYFLEAFMPAEALTGFDPAGASAAGLHLCGARPRVGRADLRRRQPHAVPGGPEPLGDAGNGEVKGEGGGRERGRHTKISLTIVANLLQETFAPFFNSALKRRLLGVIDHVHPIAATVGKDPPRNDIGCRRMVLDDPDEKRPLARQGNCGGQHLSLFGNRRVAELPGLQPEQLRSGGLAETVPRADPDRGASPTLENVENQGAGP